MCGSTAFGRIGQVERKVEGLVLLYAGWAFESPWATKCLLVREVPGAARATVLA